MQEILGTPPAWLIRWGTTIVFFVVIGIIAVSWFVKYPDIIQSQIMITTPNLPTGVVTRSSGYLSKLLVEDGEMVKESREIRLLAGTNESPGLDVDKIRHIYWPPGGICFAQDREVIYMYIQQVS